MSLTSSFSLLLPFILLISFFHYSLSYSSSETIAANKTRWEVFDAEEKLAEALAKYTADLSAKFIEEKGAFTVVLSGEDLILNIRKMLEFPYVNSIDWSKWYVFWVDERVVPKNDNLSNYKYANDNFLSKVPILSANIYSINDALDAECAAVDYEKRIKQLSKTNVLPMSQSGYPKFDLMLLGMGPDGHLASLFPGHPLLNETDKWVAAITDSPKPPPKRITMTFPVINSAANNAMVALGAIKADAVEKALKHTGDVPAGKLTAEHEAVWFLDIDAASKL